LWPVRSCYGIRSRLSFIAVITEGVTPDTARVVRNPAEQGFVSDISEVLGALKRGEHPTRFPGTGEYAFGKTSQKTA
jgi:hypothetical protein